MNGIALQIGNNKYRTDACLQESHSTDQGIRKEVVAKIMAN